MKTDHKILDDLHSQLAHDLLRRVKSGEATAAELNVVRQFLKDNGVDNSVPEKNEDALSALLQRTDSLPFNDDVSGSSH